MLHRLLLRVVVRCKAINRKASNTLNYDHTIIYNKKWDSQGTYDKAQGYQPGVAFVGTTPVYIEMRNGSMPAMYRMADSMQQCLSMLEENKINIKYFRSDSAAYQKDVVKEMDDRGIEFFIRAKKQRINQEFMVPFFWRNSKKISSRLEITSQEYEFGDKVYRLVVTRATNAAGESNVRGILTNNWEWSDEKVFYFYNARGAAERNFDDLKNNFNWGRLPFSIMEENQVYLLIQAIGNVFYRFCVKTFSQKLGWFGEEIRLKRFRFLFIDVSAMHDNGNVFIHDQRDYEILLM